MQLLCSNIAYLKQEPKKLILFIKYTTFAYLTIAKTERDK